LLNYLGIDESGESMVGFVVIIITNDDDLEKTPCRLSLGVFQELLFQRVVIFVEGEDLAGR
jgi:hypothetical protein